MREATVLLSCTMPGAIKVAIQWFRRDLRITDNTSLNQAAAHAAQVVPVYIVSEWKTHHAWTGPNRQHFLCGSLESLAANLKTIGGSLIIRQGSAVAELKKLIEETGATELHFNQDPDPYGRAIEKKVTALCDELGVSCHSYQDAVLHGPDELKTQAGQPYKVYTPYSKNWLARQKPHPRQKPADLATPENIKTLPLPTVKTWGLKMPDTQIVPPGEKAARERLRRALSERIPAYGDNRDFPAVDGTSRISQDLRFGLISIRTVFAEAMKLREKSQPRARESIDKFIKELAWREFYFAILYHFPEVLNHEFNEDWRGLPWDEPGENFEAWKQGRTGFPIVDAGMRELLATGFMHNRVRMITAMFLTKDLHIDWKQGESWFMQHLVDGEIASNNGGWQWSAGSGADAAPYFRIQNPWTQTVRYDPKGNYIKKWVPELANVHPSRFFEAPKDGRPIAEGYPLPCVNHQEERDRTLAIFKKHRGN